MENFYKLTSDGSGPGTHVYDPEWKELTEVKSIKYEIDSDGLGLLTLTVHAEADITSKTEINKLQTPEELREIDPPRVLPNSKCISLAPNPITWKVIFKENPRDYQDRPQLWDTDIYNLYIPSGLNLSQWLRELINKGCISNKKGDGAPVFM